MKIESPAFAQDQFIPEEYTCDGLNVHPPLAFVEVPAETRSLVLIMEDPDVPTSIKADGIFDHWVMFNINPIITAVAADELMIGTSGANTRGQLGYIGPCPPDREHRYFFKLYALDVTLDLPEGSTKEKIIASMEEGRIIAAAELMGRYYNRRK